MEPTSQENIEVITFPASHALTTLTSHYFPYLTLHDLHYLRITSKSMHKSLQFIEYNHSRDGIDYLVPFPGFPGVLFTADDIHNGAGLFSHQLASLRAMHLAENSSSNLAFGALRGGILGDAPGLGKTITMLSLICSTAGIKPVEPPEFYDSESIAEHWKLMRSNIVFKEEILKALRPIRDWAAQSLAASHLYRQLALEVSPPYSDGQFPTLQSMERYVYSKTRGVVPQPRLDLFRRNVVQFKAGFDKRNRRFLNTEKGRRMILERSLIPSGTTLIIVPDALLEHWAEQMRRHVNLEVFSDPHGGAGDGSHGVVWIDGVGDLSTARFPLNHRNMHLPSPFHLMNHVIVVVPFSRINEQYRQRKRGRDEETHTSGQSSLLQLRWFRIVVDEGHELGANEAESDVTKFINELAAERRWVLSGTPTTGDEDNPEFNAKGLDQLQRLLIFLRHEKYGIIPSTGNGIERQNESNYCQKKEAKSAWDTRVKQPFLRKEEEGRAELYRILNQIMVMHKKEDLALPKPIFKQADVDVPVPNEIQSAIVDAVTVEEQDTDTVLEVMKQIGVDTLAKRLDLQQKINGAFKRGGSALFDAILHQYFHTDDYQKLVDEAQGNYISHSIIKARSDLSEKGGPIFVTAPITARTYKPSESDWVDRRPVKVVVYSSSQFNLTDVTEHLYLSFRPENIAELNQGNIKSMSYELGRFRNGFKEGCDCPICGGWNDSYGAKLTSCSNLLMEVSDTEGKTFLIEPQRVRRAIGIGAREPQVVGNLVDPTRLQGESLSKYGSVTHKHWRVGDALCVDVRDPHPLLQKRWDEEVWEKYGSDKCIELMEEGRGFGRDGYLGPLPTYESGLDEVLVKLKKWQPCGRFHGKSRWYTGPSVETVPLREEKEDVFILCLDASLAHGLDLSFVTHMFLLEPIDDAALLEQVTSRAHRLGSTGPVTIETVNVWPEMDSTTKEAARRISSSAIQVGEKSSTSTAVCEHCYRSFENIEKAEIHEKTCDRNPDSTAIIDPFHLSSVYRDIRPPAPISASKDPRIMLSDDVL